MGLVHLVPQKIIDLLINKINTHFVKFFPLTDSQVPAECNPYRHLPCHCALGGIYLALRTYGVDVDLKLPWIRAWFIKYQLPDGGLNCDNEAYTKSKKSSVMSTLPSLDAIISIPAIELTESENKFLDAGAEYLINHNLVYRSSTEELISSDFLKLCFPRFYDYDILRGLSFLIKWKNLRSSCAADSAIKNGTELLKTKLISGYILNERSVFYDESETLTPDINNNWEWMPSMYFPLLELVGKKGSRSDFLLKEFNEVMKKI